MNKILKSNSFKVCLFSFCICFLMSIFNNIADIYNMNFLHKILCVFSITFTQVFIVPLFTFLKQELHK